MLQGCDQTSAQVHVGRIDLILEINVLFVVHLVLCFQHLCVMLEILTFKVAPKPSADVIVLCPKYREGWNMPDGENTC